MRRQVVAGRDKIGDQAVAGVARDRPCKTLMASRRAAGIGLVKSVLVGHIEDKPSLSRGGADGILAQRNPVKAEGGLTAKRWSPASVVYLDAATPYRFGGLSSLSRMIASS
jgi:hypothetical protein